MRRAAFFLPAVLVFVALAGSTAPAAATSEPSSDLLLPWFEVHLTGSRTTLFALANGADEPVEVRASVHTNWGIRVVDRILVLQGGEVRTVNLRDWIVAGDVPPPRLRGDDLGHVQAALTGQPSPKDGLFYSTQADPFDPELASGYVTFRVTGNPRSDVLWGDYFWVDPEQDFAEGEVLVNIDRSAPCGDLCHRHRMRFVDGGGFDGGTKLVVWSPKQLQPAPNANAATARNLLTVSGFHKEPGETFDERVMELLPVQLVDVRDLALGEDFGWLEMASDDDIYVGVRYSASHRYSVTLQTWCFPDEAPPAAPGKGAIDLEKSTNGADADLPPGPVVSSEGTVVWQYRVTNTGQVTLRQVAVEDDQEGAIACPDATLAPGETMTCTKTGSASAAGSSEVLYANVGTVTALTPTGDPVSDSDPSHYHVPPAVVTPAAAVAIEKATNGEDADQAPGPSIEAGDPVTWTYVVTNTGNVGLTAVTVTDDLEGPIACPKSALAPGESMTCTKSGTAGVGPYANVGSVSGAPVTGGSPVVDSDPSHYHGTEPPPECITRDFEELGKGQVVTRIAGADVGGSRRVRAFDSGHWSCGDPDLQTPGYGFYNTVARGKVLILEGTSSCQPDDYGGGGTFTFAFDRPNLVTGVGLLDVEEYGGRIRGYLGADKVVDLSIGKLGDNSWQLADLGSKVVDRLEVRLGGSGAVTELYCGNPPPPKKCDDHLVTGKTGGGGGGDTCDDEHHHDH